MSKPRWRWATRDNPCRWIMTRRLWTRKPQWYCGMWVPGAWKKDKPREWHIHSRHNYERTNKSLPVERKDFFKRFGHDLRPGEKVRLP